MTLDFMPDAITLDICLPDIDGWRVLDRLKKDLTTRHIPVCVMSTEEARERSFELGAIDFVAKPLQTREALEEPIANLRDFVDRPVRSLLVVEPDDARRDDLPDFLGAEDVQVTAVADGREAIQMLRERRIDCMVLNPQLPDMTVLELAE